MYLVEAIAASPESTAYQIIDGQRVYLGYGNGSVFMAERDGFLIRHQVKDISKIDQTRWKPLSSKSV